eukprot:snap_masked-scaffold_120-processed-gene-0.15-mRNA-1 protein AED:1.00 eAED:1.00 QI:0/0/0/0/1/1/2/0/64
MKEVRMLVSEDIETKDTFSNEDETEISVKIPTSPKRKQQATLPAESAKGREIGFNSWNEEEQIE